MANAVSKSSRIPQVIWYGFVAIAIGLPFHAFVITWLGTAAPSSVVTIVRNWKEIILVAMGVAATWLVVRDKAIAGRLIRDRFAWVLGLFTLIHIVIYLFFGGAAYPSILGLKINLGFLFLYLILSLTQGRILRQTASLGYLILIPAGIVSFIGLLQLTVLPHDILHHFGYGPAGGPNPAYYLIENSRTIRIMSTLWGPNQFGSYLVLPVILSFWCLVRGQKRLQILGAITFILTVISLYGSQSRGAWLAAVIGLGFMSLFLVRKTGKIIILTSLAVVGLILAVAIANHQLPPKLEVLLLHGVHSNGPTGFISSNEGHLRALTMGESLVRAHPLGSGLEAAGRASEGLPNQLYTENYYLQLAVQIGIEGLVIFLAIIAFIAWRFVPKANAHPLFLPLLASFLGLTINNLFAHTWSDGATAWIWWGLAGIVIAQSRLEHD